MDLVPTSGKMDANTKVTGPRTLCMDKACTHGQTGENMTANMKMIRKMEMVPFTGLTAVSIQVAGAMANNMERPTSQRQMANIVKESGKKASVWAGCTTLALHRSLINQHWATRLNRYSKPNENLLNNQPDSNL